MFLCACEGARHILIYVGWGWGKEEGIKHSKMCLKVCSYSSHKNCCKRGVVMHHHSVTSMWLKPWEEWFQSSHISNSHYNPQSHCFEIFCLNIWVVTIKDTIRAMGNGTICVVELSSWYILHKALRIKVLKVIKNFNSYVWNKCPI